MVRSLKNRVRRLAHIHVDRSPLTTPAQEKEAEVTLLRQIVGAETEAVRRLVQCMQNRPGCRIDIARARDALRLRAEELQQLTGEPIADGVLEQLGP